MYTHVCMHVRMCSSALQRTLVFLRLGFTSLGAPNLLNSRTRSRKRERESCSSVIEVLKTGQDEGGGSRNSNQSARETASEKERGRVRGKRSESERKIINFPSSLARSGPRGGRCPQQQEALHSYAGFLLYKADTAALKPQIKQQVIFGK